MDRSEQLFNRAQLSIPGGVNSPVRAFRSVGGTPVFVRSSDGCMLVDIDGRPPLPWLKDDLWVVSAQHGSSIVSVPAE